MARLVSKVLVLLYLSVIFASGATLDIIPPEACHVLCSRSCPFGVYSDYLRCCGRVFRSATISPLILCAQELIDRNEVVCALRMLSCDALDELDTGHAWNRDAVLDLIKSINPGDLLDFLSTRPPHPSPRHAWLCEMIFEVYPENWEFLLAAKLSSGKTLVKQRRGATILCGFLGCSDMSTKRYAAELVVDLGCTSQAFKDSAWRILAEAINDDAVSTRDKVWFAKALLLARSVAGQMLVTEEPRRAIFSVLFGLSQTEDITVRLKHLCWEAVLETRDYGNHDSWAPSEQRLAVLDAIVRVSICHSLSSLRIIEAAIFALAVDSDICLANTEQRLILASKTLLYVRKGFPHQKTEAAKIVACFNDAAITDDVKKEIATICFKLLDKSFLTMGETLDAANAVLKFGDDGMRIRTFQKVMRMSCVPGLTLSDRQNVAKFILSAKNERGLLIASPTDMLLAIDYAIRIIRDVACDEQNRACIAQSIFAAERFATDDQLRAVIPIVFASLNGSYDGENGILANRILQHRVTPLQQRREILSAFTSLVMAEIPLSIGDRRDYAEYILDARAVAGHAQIRAATDLMYQYVTDSSSSLGDRVKRSFAVSKLDPLFLPAQLHVIQGIRSTTSADVLLDPDE